jgi:Dual specificity phosphatase, catalytic domain
MIEILPGLFLGNRESARNKERLLERGVTHIVNCADELPCYFDGDFVYKVLRLRDPDPTFHTRLSDACAFIDVARGHGKVLVHCFAAISRSPAIVLAYLCFLGDNLEVAARRLGRLAWTDPDPIFLRQIAEHFEHEWSTDVHDRLTAWLRAQPDALGQQ